MFNDIEFELVIEAVKLTLRTMDEMAQDERDSLVDALEKLRAARKVTN